MMCTLVMAAVAIPANPIFTTDLSQPKPFQRNFASDISTDTEIIGFLEPQVYEENDDFSAIMLDLLPEFTTILKKFGGSNGAKLGPTEMMSAFFPIIRKAMEAKAKSEDRELTDEEIKSLNLSETSIFLATSVMESINEKDSTSQIINTLMSIARPIMEAKAANEDRGLTFQESQSLTQTENAINAAFTIMDDFNGIDNNIADMVPTFMKLSKFILEARAQNESRLVTYEEEEFLRFTESTMTGALDFIQEIISGVATAEDIEQFISTTRSLFEQQAINKGRSSLSVQDENNLHLTESILGLALSGMKNLPNKN